VRWKRYLYTRHQTVSIDRVPNKAMAERLTVPVEIYRVKITLSGSRPAIWRRFLVKGDISLARLHDIVQYVMGWDDAHLHQFTIRGKRYGMRDENESGKLLDESKYCLAEVISGGHFGYLYDFGDNWEHTLEVESVGPPEGKIRYPVCVDGARACPPEDVGGISGYEHFLEAVRDPRHPEHNDYRDWIGDDDFDSEAFDVAKVNRLLRALQR
jgi:Plasmid pRiA4b ORF-3-like protein